ncbi:hypothetical protein [Pseudomonas sp. MNR3A]|uniref:hypothetical protein n=1 Tax=Pseudomonas sp. MNR3A TaxID=2615213 RepID=UPI00129A62A5|nr:hypothetical protein [Pseudomonas sp. MNR3A]
MFTLDSLPRNFRPYKNLNVCSNKLLGGGHLFSVGNKLPIIVGAGVKPQIWLYGVTSPDRARNTLLVDSSIAQHSWVRVEEAGRQLLVKVHGSTVLRVEQTGEDQAVVSEIDLRPIGYNVHGGVSSLSIGGVQFSGSIFNNVGVVAGFKG